MRPDRVAEQIRIELGEILQQELDDPRLELTTCTRVQVTGDLKLAKVYVSVLAEPEAQKKSMAALEHAAGFVRRLLGERLGLRSAPEIRFVFDPSVEYGIRLEQLIEEAGHAQTDEPAKPDVPAKPDKPDETDEPSD